MPPRDVFAHRYANGRKKLALTNVRRRAVEAERAERVQQARDRDLIAAQPHRRDAKDPLDARLGSALGRFCLAFFQHEPAVERGGTAYGDLRRRLRAAKGVPTEIRAGAGGNGEGPSTATVRAWERQEADVLHSLRLACGDAAVKAVDRLILEDRDLDGNEFPIARLALWELAIEMQAMPRSRHPYGARAA